MLFTKSLAACQSVWELRQAAPRSPAGRAGHAHPYVSGLSSYGLIIG